VVIVVYRITRRPALYVPNRLLFTHAWLPRDEFDEVIEREGWIFGRRGQGYLALRSQRPYRWQGAPSHDRGREIIADGRENIWICELGREAVDGDFADFLGRIADARLDYHGLRVSYDSPSQGRLEFGWEGPLRQNGQPLAVVDYPRYDNPYTQAEFGTGQFVIEHHGRRLELDFQRGTRKIDG
jgi:hypothetical protein